MNLYACINIVMSNLKIIVRLNETKNCMYKIKKVMHISCDSWNGPNTSTYIYTYNIRP